MKKFLTFLSLWVSFSISAFAVTVTVSTVGGPGMFNSIQLAIDSCLINPDSPDIVQILDSGPYYEALEIGSTGFYLTIEGAEGVRPLIIASQAKATLGRSSANAAIDILVGISTTVLKDIILIPDKNDPPGKGIRIYPVTSPTGGWNVRLINIVVTGNDGNDKPATMDGLNISSVATTFTDDAIDTWSTNIPCSLYLEKVICSAATQLDNNGIRILFDGTPANRASCIFGPGCVFSYHSQDGIYIGLSNYCDAVLSGSSTEPIIVTNNARWGIWDYNTVSYSGITSMNWVIVTNNDSCGYRLSGAGTPTTVLITNCTFANNKAEAIRNDSTSTILLDASLGNVIIAGNGNLAVANNAINLGSGATLNIANSAIVKEGPYSLATVIGTVSTTAVITRDPIFWSLEPASPKFAVVGSVLYSSAGPGGTPLTGGGRFELNTEVLQVSPSYATIPIGGTKVFSATGGTPPYTWTSSDTTVGVIGPTTGMFTALSVGTTIITATDSEGFTGTATAVVVPTSAPLYREKEETAVFGSERYINYELFD